MSQAAGPDVRRKGGQTVLNLQVCINKDGELCSGFAEKGSSLCAIHHSPGCGTGLLVGHRDNVVQDHENRRCRLWLLYSVGKKQIISRLPPGSAPKQVNSSKL